MLSGPKHTVKKARTFRRAMSVPEVRLWVRLRERPAGFKFRRQHPAGPYVLDFYCHEARLAIEVDGIAHDMGDAPERDGERDAWLATQGVATLRLRAVDVIRDIDAAVGAIVHACRLRLPLHHAAHGSPPRSGEDV
ncbi:endonuclease domain-containing protein [Sphingomonas nostoxanthinifaciens]|uniref:endonuclease domain-containing protein n=1 Tax=Sphingomonas nostoxanthinifaciens TaxID=2872652 RepID=UPI001CC1F1A1|nr:DUF559 domain-containing protein [Sphingomonas nostoxanthinifaciens]UAK24929.1 DUF559 domain-containing protein [Sphingomonas nostoxanthinifaciens]